MLTYKSRERVALSQGKPHYKTVQCQIRECFPLQEDSKYQRPVHSHSATTPMNIRNKGQRTNSAAASLT